MSLILKIGLMNFWSTPFVELEPHLQVFIICLSLLICILPFVIIHVLAFNKAEKRRKRKEEFALFLLKKYGSWDNVVKNSPHSK